MQRRELLCKQIYHPARDLLPTDCCLELPIHSLALAALALPDPHGIVDVGAGCGMRMYHSMGHHRWIPRGSSSDHVWRGDATPLGHVGGCCAVECGCCPLHHSLVGGLAHSWGGRIQSVVVDLVGWHHTAGEQVVFLLPPLERHVGVGTSLRAFASPQDPNNHNHLNNTTLPPSPHTTTTITTTRRGVLYRWNDG